MVSHSTPEGVNLWVFLNVNDLQTYLMLKATLYDYNSFYFPLILGRIMGETWLFLLEPAAMFSLFLELFLIKLMWE